MFSEPLEPWELWVYPLLTLVTVGWLSWPLSFYWHQVARLESLLWLVIGAGEIYHFRHQRPFLSRAILIALPLSLGYGLFNPGDPRLMFWIAIGLCLYLYALENVPGWIGALIQRWRR